MDRKCPLYLSRLESAAVQWTAVLGGVISTLLHIYTEALTSPHHRLLNYIARNDMICSTGQKKEEKKIFQIFQFFYLGGGPQSTRGGQLVNISPHSSLLPCLLILACLAVCVVDIVHYSGVGGGGGGVGVGGGSGGGGSGGGTILLLVRRLVAVSVLVWSTDSRAPAPALSAVQCEQQPG